MLFRSWSAGIDKEASAEQRESLSLAEAALRALQSNLDISISRHTKESRLADIVIEQSKFDPTFSLNGTDWDACYTAGADPGETPPADAAWRTGFRVPQLLPIKETRQEGGKSVEVDRHCA